MSSDYITSYDLPLLYSAGFRSGIADSILWKRDNGGKDWQAIADGGEYIMFVECQPDMFKREPQRTMAREEFQRRFGV